MFSFLEQLKRKGASPHSVIDQGKECGYAILNKMKKGKEGEEKKDRQWCVSVNPKWVCLLKMLICDERKERNDGPLCVYVCACLLK